MSSEAKAQGQGQLSRHDAEAMRAKSPAVPSLFQDPSKSLMIFFLLSEVVFFGMLITSYVYYQIGGIRGPNAKESLDFWRTLGFSIALFASSGTITVVDWAMPRRKKGLMITFLILTVILGTIFMFGQVTEYITLIFNDNMTMARNLFGSTFFIMTGFHGLHVTAGIIALIIMTILAALGDFDKGHSSALTAVSWYWHFVDVVWVFIFSLAYLIPYLS
jgi:heme/copper-type cytochrome/quinol oxidase subunit 3